MAKVDPETGQLLTASGQPFKPLKTQPIRDYIAATAGRPQEYHPTMDEMADSFVCLVVRMNSLVSRLTWVRLRSSIGCVNIQHF